MPTPPPPPGFEEIQQQEITKVFGRIVGVRLAFVPVVTALALWLAWVDPAPWRRAFLLVFALAFSAFFVVEAVRFRRRGLRRSSIPVNLAGAMVGQLALSMATGGLQSPLVAFAIPLALVSGLVMGAPFLRGLIAIQIAAMWGLAALALSGAVPDLNLSAFGGGARGGETAAHVVATAAALSFALVLASTLGRKVRGVFDGMVRRALSAQQESLRAHSERAQELTALSAEIAHELKNPLASVKGLSALLAQSAPAAKDAERLGVLRREVDRMESVLSEFLNFSRPLVPLALGRVDLTALCAEVAALHEGIAHDRGVELVIAPGAASGRCDPRKVKQVLINLVQNALDASPAGARVELEAAAGPGGAARVRVLDRGRGLDAAVADRVFDPGITTKARGSGLGLTIARALARQHGGDLALAPREGGGCVAELTLPGEGTRARAGAVA